MSDQPNSKKLDENQMDQLLSSFYKLEVPPQLDNLPSSWPELQAPTSPLVQPVMASSSERQNAPSSTGRAMAVIASLAACMMLVALGNMGSDNNTSENGTMAVSGENTTNSGIVDPDVETTMEEVEGFQFESGDMQPDSVAEPKKNETEN